jgi:hypothetical protein
MMFQSSRQEENNMADKMGMEALVHNLECLCREHKAMQVILSEHDDKWKPDVFHAMRSNGIHDAVHTQFREALESLEAGRPAMHVVSILAHSVDQSLLTSEMA